MKEERKEGRKEGRKKGRKEGWTERMEGKKDKMWFLSFSLSLSHTFFHLSSSFNMVRLTPSCLSLNFLIASVLVSIPSSFGSGN